MEGRPLLHLPSSLEGKVARKGAYFGMAMVVIEAAERIPLPVSFHSRVSPKASEETAMVGGGCLHGVDALVRELAREAEGFCAVD